MTQAKTYAVVSPAEAREALYPYVYVNADGSVRELHVAERQYLEEPFAPSDGARPYVKGSLDARDGWGSIKGFCHRSNVPGHLPVATAPAEDPNPPMTKAEHIQWLKEKMVGFDVIEKPDGSVEMKRNPTYVMPDTPRIANRPLNVGPLSAHMPDEPPVLPYATPHRRATDLISILARALSGLLLMLAAGAELYLTKVGAEVATFTTLSINIAIGVLLALGGALCARAAFIVWKGR